MRLGSYEDVVAAAKAINDAAGCPIEGVNAETGEPAGDVGLTTSVVDAVPSADGKTALLTVDERYAELGEKHASGLEEVKSLPDGFLPRDTGPETPQKRASSADYTAKLEAIRAELEAK